MQQSQYVKDMVRQLFPNYTINEVVGYKVKRCSFRVKNNSTQIPYMMKIYFPNNEKPLKPQKLVHALKTVNKQKHPALLQQYELVFDSKLNYIAIVEELQLVPLKILIRKRKEPFPEQMIWSVLESVIEALEVWHAAGIIHNRVKSSSVYSIKEGGYILGEPDILYMINKEISYENMLYQSQETLSKSGIQDQKADVWSCGVLIYELMVKTLPYKGKDHTTILKAMEAEYVSLDLIKTVEKSYSKNLNNIVVAMLSLDYSIRPTIAQIKKFAQTASISEEDIPAHYLLDLQEPINNDNYAQEIIKFISTLSTVKATNTEYPLNSSQSQVKHVISIASKQFFKPGKTLRQYHNKKFQDQVKLTSSNLLADCVGITQSDKLSTKNEILCKMPMFISNLSKQQSRNHYKHYNFGKFIHSTNRLEEQKSSKNIQTRAGEKFNIYTETQSPDQAETLYQMTSLSIKPGSVLDDEQTKIDFQFKSARQERDKSETQSQTYHFARTLSMNKLMLSKLSLSDQSNKQTGFKFPEIRPIPKKKDIFLHQIVNKLYQRNKQPIGKSIK